MSEHLFKFTLIDDFVVIASWQPNLERWDTWGGFHIDAFWPEAAGKPWYQELDREGVVIVKASIDLSSPEVF